MIETIVHSSAPIGLIGGAPVSRALFAQVRAQTQSLVAADGGVATALAHQAEVRAVIGDMDSADAATLAQLPPERLHRVAEQDTTDFEKCLQRCARLPSPLICQTVHRCRCSPSRPSPEPARGWCGLSARWNMHRGFRSAPQTRSADRCLCRWGRLPCCAFCPPARCRKS